jgi:8-oxo-dGTP pyrophosphatase MutT (NUDIX family)
LAESPVPALPPEARIPRLRASALCLDEERGLLTVRLKDPVTGVEHTYLPGGAIELGESPADAAERETLEETGYVVRLVGPATVKRYDFLWAGRVHDCTTHLFAARLVDRDAPPRSTATEPAYHAGVRWLRLTGESDVRAHFGFHAAIEAAVLEMLRQMRAP